MQLGATSGTIVDLADQSTDQHGKSRAAGLLIVNADDWGRDRLTTDLTLECIQAKAVSSVSGMVFMEDSERAAAVAQERGIDTGIHLNFTTPFSGPGIPHSLIDHQERIARYLLRYRLAQVMFHPGLVNSFKYVVAHQLVEFRRLYGVEPRRIDGHHHMHLCANVVFGGLLPRGTLIRRNFSFTRGEKSFGNRFYRRIIDQLAQRRHHLVDFLFSLAPLGEPGRLRRIFSLSRDFVVELESHPVNESEHRFLAGGEIFREAGDIPVATAFASLALSRKTTGNPN